jgi:hypothetical protein
MKKINKSNKKHSGKHHERLDQAEERISGIEKRLRKYYI